MTTQAMGERRGGSISLLLVFLATVLLGLMLFSMDHAIERHGDAAVQIEACFNQGKVLQKWVKPDGRILYACDIPSKCFGIVVTEINPEGVEELVTCFPNKSKTLEKLQQYFLNHNAKLVW